MQPIKARVQGNGSCAGVRCKPLQDRKYVSFQNQKTVVFASNIETNARNRTSEDFCIWIPWMLRNIHGLTLTDGLAAECFKRALLFPSSPSLEPRSFATRSRKGLVYPKIKKFQNRAVRLSCSLAVLQDFSPSAGKLGGWKNQDFAAKPKGGGL